MRWGRPLLLVAIAAVGVIVLVALSKGGNGDTESDVSGSPTVFGGYVARDVPTEPPSVPTATPTIGTVATQEPEVSGVQEGEVEGDTGGESVGGHEEIMELVRGYDWPDLTVACIIQRESNWQAFAYNPLSGTRGLMQIRPTAHEQLLLDMGLAWDDLYDPAVNLAVAYAIYKGQPRDIPGFWAWDGSPQCWQ